MADKEKVHRLSSLSDNHPPTNDGGDSTKLTSYPFVLDTPEGLEHLAKLIHHHRRDFLLANLTQQAAMIRGIRQQLAHSIQGGGFADPQGKPLDEDAIALGIAKVFYLYTDQEEFQRDVNTTDAAAHVATNTATAVMSTEQSQQPEDEEAPSIQAHPMAFSSESHATAAPSAATTQMTSALTEAEDCQMYEYLTNLRRSRRPAKITPSPTPADGSPKLSPTSGSSNSNRNSNHSKKHASKQPAVAKRKTVVKAKKPTERGMRSPKRTKAWKEPQKPSKEGDENDSMTQDKRQNKSGDSSSGFPNRSEVLARAAALLAQTQASLDIPKGVTVRPSGRWQSQVYYKGQSRYLGVYSDSREAAMAWTIAKALLTDVQVPGATKAETDQWYSMVRDVVTDLVQGAIESTV